MKPGIRRFSTVFAGRTIYEAVNYFFDYVIYPLVLLKFGFLNGLLILISLTAVFNLFMLVFYFKLNIDWLGYNYIDDAKGWSVNGTGIRKTIGTILRKSDIFVFIVLSTFRDSFETTAYFRHSYSLSKRKTLSIFVSSLVVGNLYWALGVELFINSWLKHLISI